MTASSRMRLKRRPGSRLHFLKESECVMLRCLLKLHFQRQKKMYESSEVHSLIELYQILGGNSQDIDL